MNRLASLTALLALVASSAPAAAKCAMSHLRPKIVTTEAIAGGSIVVATEQVGYDVKDEGDATQPTWQIEMGGAASAPKLETLAPGLVAYHLPGGAGPAKVLDGKKTVLATVTMIMKDMPAPLGAPKVKEVHLDKTLGRRASAYVSVTLDGRAPAGAVALVLADAKGTALSFGLVDTKEPKIMVYAHGRCGVVPNGTVESTIGDKVTLFWVDGSGRKSPASKVVKVTGALPTAEED